MKITPRITALVVCMALLTTLFPLHAHALSGKVVDVSENMTFTVASANRNITVRLGGIYPPADLTPDQARQYLLQRMRMHEVDIRGYGNGFASDLVVEGYSFKRTLLREGWTTTKPAVQLASTMPPMQNNAADSTEQIMVNSEASGSTEVTETTGASEAPKTMGDSSARMTSTPAPTTATTAFATTETTAATTTSVTPDAATASSSAPAGAAPALAAPPAAMNSRNNTKALYPSLAGDAEKKQNAPRFFVGAVAGLHRFNNSESYYPVQDNGMLTGLVFRSFLTEYVGIGASALYAQHGGKDSVTADGTKWELSDIDYKGYGYFLDFLFTPFGRNEEVIPYLMASPGFVSYTASGTGTEKSTGDSLSLHDYSDDSTAFSLGAGMLYTPGKSGWSLGLEGRYIRYTDAEEFAPTSSTGVYFVGGYLF